MSTHRGVWDCHTHIYGPWKAFPLPEGAAYLPALAPMDDLLAMHDRIGVSHGVLVQAACYGRDHSALLDGIAMTGGAVSRRCARRRCHHGRRTASSRPRGRARRSFQLHGAPAWRAQLRSTA
ncbi:amidohydrolase family protein [Pandoraea cepalis]|uniref:amidohydrolase family protein n=1 Tax=Pandoraea cepalis TaxID=2508294 RepID=UPI001C2CDABC